MLVIHINIKCVITELQMLLKVVYLMNQRLQVDKVRKVKEEMFMRLTKLGGQQGQGHCAPHAKFQLSSISRCRDIKDLKISCQAVPSHPLFCRALISNHQCIEA